MLYRHGDVLIQQVDEKPSNLRKLPHLILAHGEVTGHSHRIKNSSAGTLFQYSEGLLLHITEENATVIHEEHSPITLPKGYYRVWRQREYSPEEIRTIRD